MVVLTTLFGHSEHTGHTPRIQHGCGPTVLLLTKPVRVYAEMNLISKLCYTISSIYWNLLCVTTKCSCTSGISLINLFPGLCLSYLRLMNNVYSGSRVLHGLGSGLSMHWCRSITPLLYADIPVFSEDYIEAVYLCSSPVWVLQGSTIFNSWQILVAWGFPPLLQLCSSLDGSWTDQPKTGSSAWTETTMNICCHLSGYKIWVPKQPSAELGW